MNNEAKITLHHLISTAGKEEWKVSKCSNFKSTQVLLNINSGELRGKTSSFIVLAGLLKSRVRVRVRV